MTTVFLILLLLALCGFIAYFGDLLGRRLGKKRLTVFGLRPKHTAILLTVVTGVVIAAVSFGAALLALPAFRQMVLEGERIASENSRLTQVNNQLDSESRQRLATNQRLQRENETRRTENTGLKSENTRLTATNNRLSLDATRLKNEATLLSRANEGLKSNNTQLGAANQSLSTENKRLEAQEAELRRSTGALRRQIVELRDIANGYKRDQYLFRRGETIVSDPLPAGRPPADVLQRRVDGQILEAQRLARERLQTPSARVQIQLVPPSGYPPDRARDERSVKQWVVQRAVAAGGKPLVLRLLADENAVAGFPIMLRFEWYENDVVYSKGEVITEESVDGRDLDEQVFSDILTFIQGKVRETATAPPRSMIPSEQGLGSLQWRVILQAYERIREIKGPVILRARARNETLRSGPLNVDLEVQPIESARRNRR